MGELLGVRLFLFNCCFAYRVFTGPEMGSLSFYIRLE